MAYFQDVNQNRHEFIKEEHKLKNVPYIDNSGEISSVYFVVVESFVGPREIEVSEKVYNYLENL